MPVSLLDLIVLGVVLLSALLAAVRGVTREVLAIASWAIAAVAALMLHKPLLPIASQHISNPTVALVATIAVIFLVTLVIVSFITLRISDLVLDSRIGSIDRTLGFVFGVARGLLICVIAYIFFSWLVPEKMQPDWARDARLKPFLENCGKQLQSMLPEDPEALISKYKNRQKATEGGAEAPPAEGESAKPAPVPPPNAEKPAGQTN